MASGGKELFINTQERAVSVDINRLQKFANSDRAEFMRYLLDVVGTNDDLDAGAIISEPASIETPLRAEIANGLMVKPQLASLNVLIDPGVMYAMNPDAAADDSNYKFIKDAGITTLGSLVMTANSSGSTRIDVIECQPQFTNVETDNRDIFNPTSGLFAATNVTKAKAASLTYRVRQGTAGAGFPGTVSGWLPLAVASVPNATTNNDTITFWDVRPLLNDRSFGMFNTARSFPVLHRQHGKAYYLTGHNTFSGIFESEIAGRRVGGRIRPGVPLADADSILLDNAAHQAAGQVPGATVLWYLYLLTPFGLPRWARYTDSTSGSRKPRSPRGIPVVSNVAPLADGTPSAAIALPASTGFVTATTTSAVLVAAGATDGSSNLIGGEFDGRVLSLASAAQRTIAASTLTSGSVSWSMIENTHFPANAKAVWALVTLTDAVGGVLANTGVIYSVSGLYVFDSSNSSNGIARLQGGQFAFPNMSGGAVTGSFQFPVRIPIVGDYPTLTPSTRLVQLTYSGSAGTPSAATLLIYGWEF